MMRLSAIVVTFTAVCLAATSTFAAPASDPIAGLKEWIAKPRDARPELAKEPFAATPLTKAQAEAARALLWEDHAAHLRATRQKEWDDNAITIGDKTLRLLKRTFGAKPAGGWNLYISMHGGGNAPAAVNDGQWQNQIKLYQPRDSLYIAPRAPTNTWNLWHEPNMDGLRISRRR